MDSLSPFLLLTGLVVLSLSLLLWLLQITQGLPPRKRIRVIVGLFAAGLWRTVPAWRDARPFVGGFLAWVDSFLFGILVTILILRSEASRRPPVTEAYEGFGDAMLAWYFFLFAAFFSLLVSVFIGMVTFAWLAGQRENSGVELVAEKRTP